MSKITEKVGGWLQRPGATKKDMAETLGITVVSLTNKLQGDTPWMWSEVVKISEIVGCTLDELAR